MKLHFLIPAGKEPVGIDRIAADAGRLDPNILYIITEENYAAINYGEMLRDRIVGSSSLYNDPGLRKGADIKRWVEFQEWGPEYEDTNLIVAREETVSAIIHTLMPQWDILMTWPKDQIFSVEIDFGQAADTTAT